MSDCCGGGGPAWPIGVPGEWPCEHFVGTIEPLPEFDYEAFSWEGLANASTVLGGSPTFTSDERPATVILTEVFPPRLDVPLAWPAACFESTVGCHEWLDIWNPQTWGWHALIMQYTYDDPGLGTAVLQGNMPCLRHTWWWPNEDDSLIPGAIIGFSDEWNILYCSGSSTNWQLAFQGVSSLVGPEDIGGMGTLDTWAVALDQFTERINDTIEERGMPVRNKWFFCGHSYGGAIACLLAAQMKLAFPEREISLITFGCPCPGDIRVRNILKTVRQVHIQNIGDVVSSLPPNGVNLLELGAFFSTDWMTRWARWWPPDSRVYLAEDGTYTMGGNPPADVFFWSPILIFATEGLGTLDTSAHLMPAYIERLALMQH